MVGRTVAHYRIVSELGAGGMGIVYKAQDVRLERFLALKFLKPERVSDDFRRRFLQEARASSALHHPNIVHVYDIGEFEGHDYIAMEFVDGLSLRQILRERKVPVTETLRYSIQIADAMAAAHTAGIVHRDLKPGNLMITPEGLVKILDFGLAKLANQSPPVPKPPEPMGTQPDDPDSTLSVITISSDHTQLGVAVGSPAFMSPEQAMGRPVDGRSDIFSFGSILYEMLTGRRAFLGDKTADVINDVIRKQPPAPSTQNPAVTAELDSVVMRAIRKDPSQRFQSMGDLKAELQALMGGSSSSYLAGSPYSARSRRRSVAAVVAAAVGVIGPLAYLAVRNRPAAATRPGVTAPLQATRLTLDPGLNIDPAISPDGKFVAYASDRSGEGNLDIWVRQIGGGEPIRLTRDPAEERTPAFSPDGTLIAFRSEHDGGGIYIVPTLGGEPRRIIPEGRGPRFSPDGGRIAYWKGVRDPFPLRAGNGSAFIYDLATGQTRQIAADFPAAVCPVWSPDGKRIVFIGLKDPAIPRTFNWWIVPLAGGAPVYFPVNNNYLLVPFAWHGDRIFYESGGGQIGSKIGQVRIDLRSFRPASTPAYLTAGTTDEFNPSVSRDGKLVFSALTRNTNLYVLPLDVNRGMALGPPQPLTKDLGENIARSVSVDGQRVVFLTRRPADGPNQIWMRDLAGGERALTSGGRDKTAVEITPDGTRVAWRESSTRVTEMFVTPVDGGPAAKLCSECFGQAVWTPRGEQALVTRLAAGGGIGLVKSEGGRPSPYLPNPPGLELRAKAISRDGKWLAFTAHRSQSDFTIYVAPFAPNRPPDRTEWIEVARSADTHPFPRWSPDGNLLYFGSSRDGYDCIWAQRLQARSKRPEGKPFVIQHFHLPTQVLESPSFILPLVLASNGAIVSITERTGGLWALDLDTK